MKNVLQSFVLCFPVAVLVGGCTHPAPMSPVTARATTTRSQSQSAKRPIAPEVVINGDTLPETSGKEERHEGVHQGEGHIGEHHDEGEEPHHDHFEAEGALVTNHGVALFQETQNAGGHSPEQRARIVAMRLNRTAERQGLDPRNIVAIPANGLPTVSFAPSTGKTIVLVTIDAQTASQFGYKSEPGLLANWWRDVLRDHAAIIAGNSPLYTTPYSSALQKVYSLCQSQQKGVPTHESFERALEKLSRDDRDDLQGLYIQVPRNYRPQAN